MTYEYSLYRSGSELTKAIQIVKIENRYYFLTVVVGVTSASRKLLRSIQNLT